MIAFLLAALAGLSCCFVGLVTLITLVALLLLVGGWLFHALVVVMQQMTG